MQRNDPESQPTRTSSARPVGVLVVDDVEGVRNVLAAGLQQYGFTVWLARNGFEALDLYQSHSASIDMLLLDVLVPDRDGPQTLADIQQFDPDVRACFLTGCSGQHSVESLLDCGAIAVFRKPVRFGELAERLVELMARPTDAVGSCA